jgi:hypothetical protein
VTEVALMNPILCAPAILIDPQAGWQRIEKEIGDPADLMLRYVALLAAIPAVFGFVGACVIGVVVPHKGVLRTPLLDGSLEAVFGYLESFLLVLLLALIINLAAPLFGGRRNYVGALKLTVYSYTPLWLAGIFLILPGLRFLMLSGFYGVYVLIAGLPLLMKAPKQRTASFAALILVFACALTFIAAVAQTALFGTPSL